MTRLQRRVDGMQKIALKVRNTCFAHAALPAAICCLTSSLGKLSLYILLIWAPEALL